MNTDDNKRNILYFHADSMSALHENLLEWQTQNRKRFLSLSVQPDKGGFGCIALTNPSEVVIVAQGHTQGDDNYTEIWRTKQHSLLVSQR